VAGARRSGLSPDSSNTCISFEIERLGLRWFSVDFRDVTGDFALGPDGQGASLTRGGAH
jgi:hypothetical protein